MVSGFSTHVRRPPAHPGTKLRDVLREQSGFTLIEALVVMLMLGVIFTAAAGFYQVVVNRTDSAAARANTLAELRTTIERVSRDVREGKAVTISTTYGGTSTTSGNVLTIDTPVERIVWDCSTGSCTRTERSRTSPYAVTAGPVTEITGLDVSTAAFTSVAPITSGATNVQVRFSQLPDSRSRPIVLSEDIAIRNTCVADPNGLLPACS